MAIQVTNTLEYNYGSYAQPYFRLTLHYPIGGTQTPVDCFMYPSKEQYVSGSSQLACWPFYVDTTNAPESGSGYSVVDKYLYFVTEKVVEQMQVTYPSSSFEIVGIPTEAPVTGSGEDLESDPLQDGSF
jgi:hypothetical protein